MAETQHLRPATLGNTLAKTHGASSERQIRPLALNHRRRMLRRFGLSARELDPIGRGYLDLYCRTQAKVETIDAYIAEHGLIRADGEPQPVMRIYTTLTNSARLALARLEQHIHTRTSDPVVELNRYLDAKAAARGA